MFMLLVENIHQKVGKGSVIYLFVLVTNLRKRRCREI